MEELTVFAVRYRDEMLLADLIDGRFDPVVPVLVEDRLSELRSEGWVVVSERTRFNPTADGVELGGAKEFRLKRG